MGVSAHSNELGGGSTAELRTVIYLCGTNGLLLDEAERRCIEYAQRFGWQVIGSVRDGSDRAGLRQIIGTMRSLRIDLITTDSLDMISDEQSVRDELMAVIERANCIVQPIDKSLAESRALETSARDS
jgi:hypothetical protein